MTKDEYAKESQDIYNMIVHIRLICEIIRETEKFVQEEIKKDIDEIDFEEIDVKLGYIEFKQLEIKYITSKVNEKIAVLRNVELEN